MGIAHVLRDYVAWFTLDFLLLTNDFNSTTATKGVGLHDVHMLVAIGFTLSSEFAEVIWE
jgi:hypothetical protein